MSKNILAIVTKRDALFDKLIPFDGINDKPPTDGIFSQKVKKEINQTTEDRKRYVLFFF